MPSPTELLDIYEHLTPIITNELFCYCSAGDWTQGLCSNTKTKRNTLEMDNRAWSVVYVAQNPEFHHQQVKK
jgi:hypothetical protein